MPESGFMWFTLKLLVISTALSLYSLLVISGALYRYNCDCVLVLTRNYTSGAAKELTSKGGPASKRSQGLFNSWFSSVSKGHHVGKVDQAG